MVSASTRPAGRASTRADPERGARDHEGGPGDGPAGGAAVPGPAGGAGLTDGADGRSDEELVRASHEDAEAFGEVYARHVEAVLAWSYRRTGCPHTANDLTAEVFAQAFLRRHRYRADRGPVRAWLFGFARNEHRQLLRRGEVAERARRRLRLDPLTVDDESLARIEALVDFGPVREAIGTLAPGVGQAVMLRVGYRLPYDEIAERLGCTPGAARVRVARGLVQLADAVGHERGTAAAGTATTVPDAAARRTAVLPQKEST